MQTSSQKRHLHLAGLAAVACCSLACAAEGRGPDETDATGTTDESADALKDGVFTFERPEIGIMVTNGGTFCGATLVSANVAVTAAHCVGYATADGAGKKLGFFRVQREPGAYVDFEYDAHVSFGRSPGDDDVAILRLTLPVPRELATPSTIADAIPERGTFVTLFGFGCSNRPGLINPSRPDDHTERKQKRSFALGSTRYVCPGDSGGPTVVDSTGDVFRVSSKMGSLDLWGFSLPDVYGDVTRHRAAILTYVREWAPAAPSTSPSSSSTSTSPPP